MERHAEAAARIVELDDGRGHVQVGVVDGQDRCGILGVENVAGDGEFAGFEILPHQDGDHGWVASHAPDWATWLTALYPNGGEIYWDWSWEFGKLVLAFPFHRVGHNLDDLVLLTIYMGAVHVLLGLIIGFRDIWIHGDSHGNTGPVVAFFDRGSWITILIAGYFFATGYFGLGLQMPQFPNPADDALTMMYNCGFIFVVRSEERRVGKECRSAWPPYP